MADKVRCPKCGAENYASDPKCLSCGTDLFGTGSERICPKCGYMMGRLDRQCPQCRLREAAQQQQASAPPVAAPPSVSWSGPIWSSSVGKWEKTGWAIGFALALFFGFGVGLLVHWAAGAAVGLAFGLLGRWVGRLHDRAEREGAGAGSRAAQAHAQPPEVAQAAGAVPSGQPAPVPTWKWVIYAALGSVSGVFAVIGGIIWAVAASNPNTRRLAWWTSAWGGASVVLGVFLWLLSVGSFSGFTGGVSPSAGLSQRGVTLAQYGQVQPGMTEADVFGIIGTGQETVRSDMAGIVTVMYEWPGSGSLGANMNAMFQNGRLVQKAQFGLR